MLIVSPTHTYLHCLELVTNYLLKWWSISIKKCKKYLFSHSMSILLIFSGFDSHVDDLPATTAQLIADSTEKKFHFNPFKGKLFKKKQYSFDFHWPTYQLLLSSWVLCFFCSYNSYQVSEYIQIYAERYYLCTQ